MRNPGGHFRFAALNAPLRHGLRLEKLNTKYGLKLSTPASPVCPKDARDHLPRRKENVHLLHPTRGDGLPIAILGNGNGLKY